MYRPGRKGGAGTKKFSLAGAGKEQFDLILQNGGADCKSHTETTEYSNQSGNGFKLDIK